MAEWFSVVFSGQISGRADPAQVRANIAKLFNANEAVLDRLFSGQPVAVKKKIDRETAMKIRAAMKQAGADAQIIQVDEEGRPLAPVTAGAAATPTVTVKPSVASMPSADSAERVTAKTPITSAASSPIASQASTSTPTWQIAPTGTRLSDPAPPAPPAPDISAIKLAPAGGVLVDDSEYQRPAPVSVDISLLSMAPAGTEVLREDERDTVIPVVVDISGISVAEVGAPLDEIREEKPPVVVDISHLQMSS